jgi:hypothetical protein
MSKILAGLAIWGVVLSTLFAFSFTANAQFKEELCGGADLSLSSGNCGPKDEAENKVNKIIKQVINIISVIVGVVAVIMIIIGGFRYITSGGDSGAVGNAKNTIIYALVGLVIVFFAQIIVRFVLGRIN